MSNSIVIGNLFKVPNMMSISNAILHKNEVAKTLESSEVTMKQLRETLGNNL